MGSSNKRFTALVGFILLIGCMVGIGVLIFGFGPSFTHGPEPEESFKDWQAEDYMGSNIRELGEKTRHDTNNVLELEELERLFSKDSSRRSTSTVIPVKPTTHKTEKHVSKVAKVVPVEVTTISEEPVVFRVSESSVVVKPGKGSTISESDSIKSTTIASPPNVPKLQLRGLPVPTANLSPILPQPMRPDSIDRVGVNESYEDDDSGSQEMVIPGKANDNGYDEDAYTSDDEDDGGAIVALGDLLGLATNLYTSGTNSTLMNSFLKVINETLNQGNNSGILAQLNELYSRPEFASAVGPGDIFTGRNSYETSLTAFVFMSFGVFLLNQIHSLISKENNGGRSFNSEYLDKSNLDILFEPPFQNNLTEGNENSFGHSRTIDEEDASSSMSPNYVNNMFRGFLNLVNAYSKNSNALECIWSLYCTELDQTSAKEGLYGLAARINSIGLRLIMHQIPTELTLDVMLRSLLGWDGLPCKKMFTGCDAEKAGAALKAAGSTNNNHSF